MKRCSPTVAVAVLAVAIGLLPQRGSGAQYGAPVKTGSSPNMKLVGHLPMGGFFRAGGIDLEQELARPFVYVARMLGEPGFDIVDLRKPEQPSIIYSWRFDPAVQRIGLGGESLKYFKLDGRYYLVKGVAFEKGSPDEGLSAIVFDVSGLPDPKSVKEIARVPGGRVTHIFTYKHSDGLYASLHDTEFLALCKRLRSRTARSRGSRPRIHRPRASPGESVKQCVTRLP